MAKYDPIAGKYIYLTVQGIEYRIYMEEAGKGIPITPNNLSYYIHNTGNFPCDCVGFSGFACFKLSAP